MKLLSGVHIQQIEDHLSTLLNRIFCAEGLASVNCVIRAYVLSGGKRIRPQLCVWTYEQAGARGMGQVGLPDSHGRGASDTPLLDLACAWELFHAFLLAHDDIIDNSDTRRDQPSLHRRLAHLDGNSKQFGVNLGIVAGDLLFSAAMRLWHDLDLPDDVYRNELKLFSRIAALTGFGQAIDIFQSHAGLDTVDEELLLREYHWKTAAYTFEGPMVSAAILARLGIDAQETISRFALALGQAYQLQNDLLDLAQPAHEGADLVQGKRTIPLLRARSEMSAARRLDFDRKLSELRHANGQTVPLAESLRRELRDTGAIQQTNGLIDDFLQTASRATADPSLPSSLGVGLNSLMQSLRTQYFTSVEI